MGPAEQFQNVSFPGIPDFTDDRSNPTFYDRMEDSDGDNSDADEDDKGEVDGGLPSDGGPGGEGGCSSPCRPRQQGSCTLGEQYYVGDFDAACAVGNRCAWQRRPSAVWWWRRSGGRAYAAATIGRFPCPWCSAAGTCRFTCRWCNAAAIGRLPCRWCKPGLGIGDQLPTKFH
jgi:hypothetical protein